MSNIALNKNESIIYEEQCKINNKNTVITLTNERILIEQFKGLINKTLKVVDEIKLDRIKVVNNKVQVKVEDTTLTLKTLDKVLTINLNTNKDAKKLAANIINVKTGTTKFDRTAASIGSILTTTLGVLTVVGGIAKQSKKILNIFKKK